MRRTLMVALLAVSPGCGGGGSAPTPVAGPPAPQPTPTPTPAASPTPPPSGGTATFTAVYDRVIVVNCNGCHGEPPVLDAGVLLMATKAQAYAQLVNVPASGSACAGQGRIRVIPGNPDGSLLFNKVSRPQPVCGLPMPAPTGGLPASDVQLIRDWILAGALND